MARHQLVLRVLFQSPLYSFAIMRRHCIVDCDWSCCWWCIVWLPNATFWAFFTCACSGSKWFFRHRIFLNLVSHSKWKTVTYVGLFLSLSMPVIKYNFIVFCLLGIWIKRKPIWRRLLEKICKKRCKLSGRKACFYGDRGMENTGPITQSGSSWVFLTANVAI